MKTLLIHARMITYSPRLTLEYPVGDDRGDQRGGFQTTAHLTVDARRRVQAVCVMQRE